MLELRHVGLVIAGKDAETSIVAVGEGSKGEARDGEFLGDATVHVDGDSEGDVCVHSNESLGELEGGVYVALCGVDYEEEVVAHHGGWWLVRA